MHPLLCRGRDFFLRTVLTSRRHLVNSDGGVLDMPLAEWAVDCKSCKKAISHSEIPEPQHAIDFMLPAKPRIAVGGQELECPHCKSKTIYQGTDLWYRIANAQSTPK